MYVYSIRERKVFIMSYNNFKATIWSKEIQRENERLCVFAADTNQKFEGEIKNAGDSVRIQGVGKPTVTLFDTANGDVVLNGAETVEDTSVTLVANNVATFNYKVDDIDKAQGADVMSALNQESTEVCSNEIDRVVANLSLDNQAQKSALTLITKDNVLDLLDNALEQLYLADVSPSTTITATVSPKFYTLFRKAYVKLDTNNSEELKNGKMSMYNNCIIRMSNNVAKDKSGNELIQVKTQRAIALAQSKPHVEPYRPENSFSDAVKGFIIFGTKLIRPKEFYNINVKYA